MPRVKRVYDVDMSLPIVRRFDEVLEHERTNAKSLIQTCVREAELIASRSFLGGLFLSYARENAGALFKDVLRPWRDELLMWSDSCDIPMTDLFFANLVYEVTQFPSGIPFKPFGCTAAACCLPDLGMVHVRHLDWPLSDMGPKTIIMRYHYPKGVVVTSVTWPGFVGMLSAMRYTPWGSENQSFSITMNQAPQVGMVKTALPPSFVLRQAVEQAQDFGRAVETMQQKMAASALFVLAGTRDACRVDNTGSEAAVIVGDLTTRAANAYRAPAFKEHNAEDDSDDREEQVQWLHESKAYDLAGVMDVMNHDPCCWELTAQRMCFRPEKGEVLAFYRNTNKAVKEYLEG